jgi:putative hydrolase of the HAD superfamily
MLTAYQHFIFDWDNTLFDYAGYWEQAHRLMYQNVPKLNQATDYETFMTIYKEKDAALWPKVSKGLLTLDELRIQRMTLTAETLSIQLSRDEAAVMFDQIFQLLLSSIKKEETLLHRLQALNKTKDIFILTNGGTWEQTEKLKRTGFFNQFPTYISETIGFEKPQKEAFDYVLQDNQLKAAEVVMIGDSLTNDILPAQKLGMTTVLIGEQNAKADFSFNTIAECLAAIEGA